jgi:NAD(P)-dependent dehydrogenase (short-subunit alcohol dehydrogenase family)
LPSLKFAFALFIDNGTEFMQGKTILITGATRGIGAVTAQELAKQGARVIVVGRDAGRAEDIARTIVAAGGVADVLVADLSVAAEVRRLAQEVRARYERLDVLVNNAGAVFTTRQENRDGIELTWALNHLSYFLLTTLLLDLLVTSGSARVVNVSSEAHRGGRINFDDPEGKRGFNAWQAYSQSKLANILFTNELARRLEGTAVTANSLHPGFVATNFGKSNGGIWQWLFSLAQFAAISPEQGAQTTIYLASSPEVAGVSGKYFDKSRPATPSPAAQDAVAATRLWELSERQIGG